MIDFTWKSLFKLWVVIFIPYTVILATDNGPHSIQEQSGWVGFFFFTALTTFCMAALFYGAGAPFIAAYKDAKRTTGSTWEGILSAIALLLVLIPVAALMFIIWLVNDLFEKVFGGFSIIAMVGTFIAGVWFWMFIYDVIKTRLHLNKLKTINLSDSRQIMRR